MLRKTYDTKPKNMSNTQRATETINSTDPLTTISELLKDDIEAVNQLIVKEAASSTELIPSIAQHLIKAGGKRIRPLLTLAANRLCDGDGVTSHPLAAAVEFIHTATLLHDDVVDSSQLRRGKPSANAVWGNKASVLVGDFLFSRSFQLMVRPKDTEVLQVLANASATIAEGEVLQLTYSHDLSISAMTAIQIIGAKTAELFAAACDVGARISGHEQRIEYAQALREYGYNLGLIFQITDDILDYTADAKGLGKSIGDDFFEGKITLPVIMCHPNCSEDEQQFWQNKLVERKAEQDDFTTAVELINSHHGFEQCQSLAEKYASLAHEALTKLPENEITQNLRAIIDFCLTREY